MREEVGTLLNDIPLSPSKAKIHNLSKTLTKFGLSSKEALSKHKPNPKLDELHKLDEIHPKPRCSPTGLYLTH